MSRKLCQGHLPYEAGDRELQEFFSRVVPDSGHIARLCTGQGHGTIRMADGRDVWFHRSDMAERAAFNDFIVGDAVTFELREDRISGARALGVHRNQGPRTSRRRSQD